MDHKPGIDLEPCLRRIGFSRALTPSLKILSVLQHGFLQHMPFENLDIHLGREISLELRPVYDKIINRRRGGFCYECNILFAWMLQQMGFDLHLLSARMLTANGSGRELDHMAINVRLDREYLVDVGNGESVRVPLAIDGSNQAEFEQKLHRVVHHGEEYQLEYETGASEPAPHFAFQNIPHRVEEFAEMCRYHQRSAESVFTRHRLVTIARGDGRTTLQDNRLTIANVAGTDEQILDSSSDYEARLRHCFGIDLNGASAPWFRRAGLPCG